MPPPLYITDKGWSELEGEACRVTVFSPNATVENGRVSSPPLNQAYAAIMFECSKPLPEDVQGMAHVFHKLDFLHLWTAWNERRDDEEVILFWAKSNLRKSARLFSKFMPRMVVMIFPKEAFELMTDPTFKPELDGRARYEAMRARAEWTPPAMQSYGQPLEEQR